MENIMRNAEEKHAQNVVYDIKLVEKIVSK